MGSFSSKSTRSCDDFEEKGTEAISKDFTTPNGKAKVIQLDRDLDPRSPSEDISRTPIQVSALPDPDTPTPVYTPKRIILTEDPRSPITEYRRTPIVVGVIQKSPTLRKIHNKNLDKALKGYSTVSAPNKTISETTTIKENGNVIPPKLLETSPVRIVKIDAHKRKSCVGLLETNIDFTETDIDEVIMRKYRSPSIKKASSEPKIYNRLNALFTEGNIDPRSPTTDFKRTPLQIVKKFNQIDANIADCASSEEGADENKMLEMNNDENSEETISSEGNKEIYDLSEGNKQIYDLKIEENEVTPKSGSLDEMVDGKINGTAESMANLTVSEFPDKSENEGQFNGPTSCDSDTVHKNYNDAFDLGCESLKTSPKKTPEKPPRKIDKFVPPTKLTATTVHIECEPNHTCVKQNDASSINNEIAENGHKMLITLDDKSIGTSKLNDHISPDNVGFNVDEKNEIRSDECKVKSNNKAVGIDKQIFHPLELNNVLKVDENETPPALLSKNFNVAKEAFTPDNKIDLTADVRDFDKKLTNLIYEDSDVSVLPPMMKSKESNRTPLGVRNQNAEAKKTSKLKVSDRPRYSGGTTETKGNSKIPVPQSKFKFNKKVVQCENTPPRNVPSCNGRSIPSFNSRKSNPGKSQKPQWDNDATLII